MSVPLISVIIPIYNSSAYLEECVSSILRQTYTELEIICVNDGSTDNSLAILCSLAKTDARIKIIDQTNLGVSKARNSGLDEARGEFIVFVDSDDTVAADMVDHFLSHVSAEIDLLIENSESDRIVSSIREKHTILLEKLRNQKLHSPGGKIYRKAVIDDFNIRFPEATSLGEDLVFNFTFYQHARKIRTIRGVRYRARTTQGSLTKSFRTTKYEEMMYVNDYLENALRPMPDSLEASLLNFRRIRALVSCVRDLTEKSNGVSKPEINASVKAMENRHPHLPVAHGDITMRIIGWMYNNLGLALTNKFVQVAQRIRHIIPL